MIQQIILLFSLLTSPMETSNPILESPIMDQREHKIIMQVTNGDSTTQLAVVGQIKNTLEALPNAQIEVVCHSQGLPLILAEKSLVAADIKDLLQRNVAFVACENTMQKQKVQKEDLLPGITTVPSGMAEIILKQEAGWVYVKPGI